MLRCVKVTKNHTDNNKLMLVGAQFHQELLQQHFPETPVWQLLKVLTTAHGQVLL
jgi:hypothetical protein